MGGDRRAGERRRNHGYRRRRRQRQCRRSDDRRLGRVTTLARLGDPFTDDLPGGAIGIAPHSIRAVTPLELEALAASFPDGPLHLHASEQPREVEACRAVHGTTPVALIADRIGLPERLCVIHGTHATPAERARLSGSLAVLGLCPITEANLGDGIFPAAAFRKAGGQGQHRHFVHHPGDKRPPELAAFQGTVPHHERAGWLTGDLAFLQDRNVRAHRPERVQQACAGGVQADVGDA